MNTAEKQPLQVPYSSELEASMLGVLLAESSILENLQFLKEEHFYAAAHQRIFHEIKAAHDAGKLANYFTLSAKFHDDPDLLELGREKYLNACLKIAAAMPKETARTLEEMYNRRELIAAFDASRNALCDWSNDLPQEAGKIAEMCDKVVAGNKQFHTQTGYEVTQSILDAMKDNRQPFSTGISRLDEAMDGGLYPGKLYGFAGKKKNGKTIFAGTVSCNLALKNVKHLFICCEMSPEEIHQRNLARMGKFYASAFRNSSSRGFDFQMRLNEAMNWQQQNILYRNAPALTFEKLRQIVKHTIAHKNITGFILDYWQLVGGKETRKSTAEHLDEIAQWCADVCRKNGIWGLVTAQINQEGNTRGSEGLRLACDQMYQIQRPDLSLPGVWLEMMETRYTPWCNIGEAENCKIQLNEFGPYMQEI